jgi:hypothetical protein
LSEFLELIIVDWNFNIVTIRVDAFGILEEVAHLKEASSYWVVVPAIPLEEVA